LPREELSELVAWLQDYHQTWDKQIEDDLNSSRLDSLVAEAEKEYQAGLSRPL
jgi:hypothetical protein